MKTHSTWRRFRFLVAVAWLSSPGGDTAFGLPAISVDWQRQIGTPQDEAATDISVDAAGNGYVAGWTAGNLNGQTNTGLRDAFQLSLDPSGGNRWTRLSGTVQDDQGQGNAAEADGTNYLIGWTREDMSGTYHGENDIFVHGFLTGGGGFSGHQWGTPSFDSGNAIGIDAPRNRYIAGQTSGNLNGQTNNGSSDAFLLKQNDSGILQWTRLLGTSGSDSASDVAVDAAGNATITGFTTGNLAGANAGFNDIFVARYDTNGNQQWVTQIGSTFIDNAWGVGIDPLGNVYVAGEAGAAIGGQTFAGGFSDALVAKFDSSGALQWARLLGTATDDSAQDIAVDQFGNSYIVGWTSGSIGGPNPFGQRQTFLAKYDTDGNLKWTHQIDTPFRLEGNGIALLGNHIYIAGASYGPLVAGQWQGGIDAFAMRFTQVPEPASLALLLAAGVLLLARRQPRNT